MENLLRPDEETESRAERQDDGVCQIFAVNPEKVARWERRLPSLAPVAELFKALADETRAKILYLLANEEFCVCDLAIILGTTVSNVSHHLRRLRAEHLVKYRREGKMAFYSLDDDHVLHLINEAFNHAQHLDR
ncbi:MAG: ArsR family transcriptional regulator, lead/cadmium/zinc/bismuth-responsive transcriptional [Bacillota bacterium]|jgi:DNA-binding transcriptional ArsR family regulator|nr:ArsR family transcriptional regulator, lead/cadmium/zinc/bismuth-responsive transcriptional [Bacillota bacterium]MDK2924473.1 ArsR family transcriptional regulator, lead/cadmium/zinc/bismuth-responsive transcriptional [Bacillota bacterium]